jgi:hypothetical protein
MGYNGLLMGCTREYWFGIIKKLYSAFGNGNFTWSDVTRRYPEITKSDLARLKCSSWIVKDRIRYAIKPHSKMRIDKSVRWKLPPEAIVLCTGGYRKTKTKHINRMLKKGCECARKPLSKNLK